MIEPTNNKPLYLANQEQVLNCVVAFHQPQHIEQKC
jgi:hypothetical protein